MQRNFLFVVALASAAAERYTLEQDALLPHASAWARVGRANGSSRISLTIAVRQSNLDALEELVLRVSDPESPAYGKHLTLEQVNALVAPRAESTEKVRDFLGARNVTSCESSASGDFVRCQVTVAEAEVLLEAEYYLYKHTKTGLTATRTSSYSLPADISGHVDFVSPTVRFPTVQRRARRASPAAGERRNTPDSLRELYRVGSAEGSAGRQACTAFLEQYYSPSDLKSFFQQYYPKAEGTKVKVVGPNSGGPGIEASLDIEFIATLGAGVETEFWSFAGRAPDNPENEPFLAWLYVVGNTSDADVPKVFSTSYGEVEASVTQAYMDRIQVEFQKAAARGISLLFATGDNGVANDDGTCPDGRFSGQWPAASVWVTGVGGTEGGSVGTPENVWSGSAGGFSDRWARPSYQSAPVDAYFASVPKDKLPESRRYNQTGAAFPDVSAQASNFLVVVSGSTIPVAGTSCACPTFSGIVSLLNSLRLAKGKSTLGYLNPLLYKNPDAFFDITTGSNSAPGKCGGTGFAAAKGWDPATGLGTPNYTAWAQVVGALP